MYGFAGRLKWPCGPNMGPGPEFVYALLGTTMCKSKTIENQDQNVEAENLSPQNETGLMLLASTLVFWSKSQWAWVNGGCYFVSASMWKCDSDISTQTLKVYEDCWHTAHSESARPWRLSPKHLDEKVTEMTANFNITELYNLFFFLKMIIVQLCYPAN